MLRFFRLLRKKLLDDNKLFKYLLYAIGEIILVIIGILIAVNLNNANEDRKQKEKIKSTLKQVQNEIQIAIDQAATQIRFASKNDSLSRVVLTQELTIEDYRKSSRLSYLTRNGFAFTLENASYDNLIQLSDNIPEEYDYLLARLKKAYQGIWPLVEDGHKVLRAKQDQYFSEDVNEHAWASDLINGKVTDEQIDYMLNDFRFKNRVSEYNQKQNGSLNRNTIEFRRVLIDCYREIDRLLGNVPDSTQRFVNNIEPYLEWIGTYELSGTEIEISQGDSSLVIRSPFYEGEIYPIDANIFHVDQASIQIIITGDSSQQGLYLANGLQVFFLKKTGKRACRIPSIIALCYAHV